MLTAVRTQQRRSAVQFVQEMQLEFPFVHGSQPGLIIEIPVRKFAVSGAVSWKSRITQCFVTGVIVRVPGRIPLSAGEF
jgi:hypothetical protein